MRRDSRCRSGTKHRWSLSAKAALEQQTPTADARLAELTDSDVVRGVRTIPGVGVATATALVSLRG
jgi:hypothetical protein